MIFPSFGLSRRKHLPVWYFNTYTWHLWQGLRLLKHGFNWTIKPNGVLTHRKGIRFQGDVGYRNLLLNEWIEWEQWYKPPFSLKGKTVLDVGAGCGETALFYFLRGANKVVCVENNPKCWPFLEKNRQVNGWNMEILPESFSLEHLKEPFDFCKMDIEGGEEALLQLGRIDFPICLEVHGKPLIEGFGKLGFQTMTTWKTRNTAIMHNYKVKGVVHG